ncbi:MAG: BamA/TamA family outer membrane protein [Bacteroidota bacterium]
MAVNTKYSLAFFLLILCSSKMFAQKQYFIRRTLDWGYKIVQGDSAKPHKKYFLVIPLFSYRPETRWNMGVSTSYIFRSKNNDTVTRPSAIRVNMAYTQNNQYSVRPQVEYFSKANKINIRAQYLFTDFTEYFWGVGNNMPLDDREQYSFRLHRLNIRVGYLLTPSFYAGLQYHYEQMFDINAPMAGILRSGNFEGAGGYLASGIGPTIYYDSRDNIFFPFKGSFIELSACFYNSALGSNYKFTGLALDARKYIRLWNENVLAAQLIWQSTVGNVPFRMLPAVGNENFMRGYYNGRFRDNNLLTAQAELRKTVWGPFSVAAFGGLGGVNASAKNIFNNQQLNLGLGLRMKAIPRERMNMRFDMSWMGDGSRAIYITMNEAF